MIICVLYQMSLSGALADLGAQVCSSVWFCGLASLGLSRDSQDNPLFPCLGLCTSKVRSAWGLQKFPGHSTPLASFLGSWKLCPSVPAGGTGGSRGSHPEVTELRENRTNELNCTPHPLVADYVSERNKAGAGFIP